MSSWVILSGLYNGTIYIYQNIVGMLYGLLFLMFCLNFDSELHQRCEKMAFILKTSRTAKFEVSFLCIGLYVLNLIYYSCTKVQWMMP